MTEPDETRELRRSLVAGLVDAGALRSPHWIAAFEAVPRHLIVPRFLARRPNAAFAPVDDDDPAQHDEWLRQVYADEPLITEVDGPFAVSSSSQPSLMAEMLEALELSGPQRVLEIGTGTGYNAALLCEGMGACEQVVSVDITRELVETARSRLASAGYRPALVTADGATGYPGGAPYDRIIATCSLPLVPREWVEQVTGGGMILVNLYRNLGGGALARLHVRDGHASGHFLPFSGGFMPTRTYHRTSAVELLERSRADGAHRSGEGPRSTTIDASVLDDDAFGMFAALRIDAERLRLLPDDEPEQFWLLGGDGSWAYQSTDDGGRVAAQGGPTRLWDGLETAYAEWVALGRPARDRFGLTVTGTGDHLLWCGDSTGPSWSFPPQPSRVATRTRES